MDKTGQRGEEPAITKRRHPASRPPHAANSPKRSFGTYRDIIGIGGDTVDLPEVEWEAEVDPDRVVNP